jgi:hypothetical protein
MLEENTRALLDRAAAQVTAGEGVAGFPGC